MADDPVAYLRNRHARAQQLARACPPGQSLLPDPADVLARVTAERAVLEDCENVLSGWTYGETRELAHDVIAGLAAGWGWTEEER